MSFTSLALSPWAAVCRSCAAVRELANLLRRQQDAPIMCITEYMPGGDLERYYMEPLLHCCTDWAHCAARAHSRAVDGKTWLRALFLYVGE